MKTIFIKNYLKKLKNLIINSFKKTNKKNKNNFKQEIFENKLLKYYLILLSLFLIFLIISINFIISNYLTNQNYTNISQKIDFLGEIVFKDFSNYDFYSIEKFLDYFLKINRNEIYQIIILNNNGFILFNKYNEYLIGKKLNYYEIKKNIYTDKNEVLYTIYTYFSRNELEKNLFMLKLFIFIIFTIILIGTFFIVYLINERLVIDNLNKIKNLLNELSKDNYQYELLLNSNDEFGTIVKNIGDIKIKMLQNINILEYIFENNSSIYILISKEGEILKVNKNYEMIFKNFSKREHIIGRNLFDIFSEFKIIIEKTYNLKEILKIKNYNFKNETLNNLFFDITVIPIIINNEISNFFIKIDDVTEEFKNINNMLIFEKMESLNLLSSGVAHDFNNILGSISGIISLMKIESELDENVSKNKVNEYIDLLNVAVEKGKNVSSRLLKFSKNIDIKKTYFDLNNVLKSLVEILKSTFDKSINININYYNGSAIIYGNEGEIEQSFMNICINAYHAMTIMRKEGEKWDGNLEISINRVIYEKDYTFYSTMKSDIIKNKEYWKISFKDSGVGIKKDHIKKIFDPFFTTKKDSKGTGLGLSLVYKIIENHEGFITVYSEENIGSLFNVYLPLVTNKDEIEKEIEKKKLKSDIIKLNKNVVIIEDDEIILETLKSILKKLGLKILFSTKNPKEGSDYLKNNLDKVDLIVLDNIMPELNGIDLLKNLYDKISFENIKNKIIMITGLPDPEKLEEFLKYKNRFYVLVKPFTIDELSNLLKEVFENGKSNWIYKKKEKFK